MTENDKKALAYGFRYRIDFPENENPLYTRDMETALTAVREIYPHIRCNITHLEKAAQP